MSLIPKKKKTPEELAALRESLGISSDGPPPGAPGVKVEQTEAAVETPGKAEPLNAMPLPEAKFAPAESRPPIEKPDEQAEPAVAIEPKGEDAAVVLETPKIPEAKTRPIRSLRKSKSLPVDRPKAVVSKDSGKLPTRRRSESERIPLEKPSEPVSAGGGVLPARKHTDRELARLRHTPIPGVEAPAVSLAARTAGPWLLAGIYGVGVVLMILAGLGVLAARAPRFDLPFDWLKEAVLLPGFSMILFGTMTGGVAVMLLGAGWIFFMKPLSQYHAAIMTIIAVLVLVFGTLYFFPGLHGA